MAALIKVVLALRHRMIPPHLHFRQPSPHIPWAELPVTVPTELTPWQRENGPRLAGVSSFGFSGTNAHVIVEEAINSPTAASDPAKTERDQLMLLSARTVDGLHGLARKYQAYLTADAHHEEPAFLDVCHTAAVRRSHLQHRLAMVSRSPQEAAGLLTAFLKGDRDARLVVGRELTPRARKVVFVFCGQGASWEGVDLDPLLEEPAFRETIERCDRLVREQAGWSVFEELRGSRPHLDDTEIAQPVLLALQASLVELWQSWGVVPDAVVGHSSGEVAAAYAAGALDLEQAVGVSVLRGRSMQPAKGQGGMVALGMPCQEAERLIAPYGNRLCVAAINGPATTVVAGDIAALDEVRRALELRHLLVRPLPVAYAFHSAQMDPCCERLLDALQGLVDPALPRLPISSTVTGGLALDGRFDAAYWAANMRQPVRFSSALDAAVSDSFGLVVEIGPHPVLAGAIAQCLSTDARQGIVVASLKREESARRSLLAAAGALHTSGVRLDYQRISPGSCIALPTSAWQRRRFWLPDVATRPGLAPAPVAHIGSTVDGRPPLAQRQLSSARTPGECFVEADLADTRLASLSECRVGGTSILPAAVYVEMARAVGRDAVGATVGVRSLRIHEPVVTLDGTPPTLQMVVTPDGAADPVIQVFRLSGQADANTPMLLASGQVASQQSQEPDAAEPLEDLMARCPRGLGGESFYAAIRDTGLVIGEGFRPVHRLWIGEGEALAELHLPDAVSGSGGYLIHPALLESAFQLLAAALPRRPDGLLLPVAFEAGYVAALPAGTCWAHARVRRHDSVGCEGDLTLRTGSGGLMASFRGLRLEVVSQARIRQALQPQLDSLFYDIRWDAQEPAVAAAQPPGMAEPLGAWLILGDEGRLGERLARTLAARGYRSAIVRPGSAFQTHGGDRWTIEPGSADDLRHLLDEIVGRDSSALSGVIHLWSADPSSDTPSLKTLHQTERTGCYTVLQLAQALGERAAAVRPRVWLITRGAESVGRSNQPIAVQHAPLWGLGRVLALEHPEIWGGLIDLDPDAPDPAQEVEALVNEIVGPGDEDQVVYRDGRRHVARLVGASADGHDSQPLQLRGDASYLITGGRGALGLKVARWLAECGARHLILTGRQPLPDRSTWRSSAIEPAVSSLLGALLQLEALGVSVHTPQADVADPDQMARLLRGSEHPWPPLRGVVHAAGIFYPRAIRELSLDDFRAVLRPKVDGTWILHELTRELELDFFVMFSSAAAVWGSALAAHYVAANHFQDMVAHERRRLGLPALAVNWGWWAGSEMVAAESQRYFEAIGLGMLSEPAGLAALERLISIGCTQRTVAPVDWGTFRPVFEAKRRRPLLSLLEASAPAAKGEASAEALALINRLQAAAADQRQPLVVEYLQSRVAEVLGHSPSRRMDPRVGFFDAGMDSITSVDLKTRLESDLGIVLPATVAFEHPNLEALAGYLLESALSPSPGAARAGAVAELDVHTAVREPDGLDDLSEDDLIEMLAVEVEAGGGS
jgi:acyl transferase domain-containing protein/acyl carrier protein